MESRVVAQKPKKDVKIFFDCIASGDLNFFQNKKNLKKLKDIMNNLYLMNISRQGVTATSNRPVNLLFCCVLDGQWDILIFLLENGANPNIESHPFPKEKPVNPLQYFLSLCHRFFDSGPKIPTPLQINKILDLFLQNNADFIKTTGVSNLTLLITIAGLIHVTFFKKLIEKIGLAAFQTHLKELAPPQVTGLSTFRTPFMLLCESGLADHVSLFLENGADPAENYNNITPLTCCMQGLQTLKLLFSDSHPQHQKELLQNKRQHFEKILDLLINALGIKIKETFGEGYTYLHVAMLDDDNQMRQRLVKLGLDVNARAFDGSTPALWAASRDKWEALQFLASIPQCDFMLGISSQTVKLTNEKEFEEYTKKTTEEIQAKTSYFFPTKVVTTPLVCAFIGCHERAVRFLLTIPERTGKATLIEYLRALIPQFNDKQRQFLSTFPDIEAEVFKEKTPTLFKDSWLIDQLIIIDEEETAISQIRAFDKSQLDFLILLTCALQYNRNRVIKCLLEEFEEQVKPFVSQDVFYIDAAVYYFCDLENIRRLLTLGAPIINAEQTVSAAHAAVAQENLPALACLLEHHSDCKDFLESGDPLLFTAAFSDKDEFAALLLKHKASPLTVCEEDNQNALVAFITRRKHALLQQVFEQFPDLDLNPAHACNRDMPYLAQAHYNQNKNLFIQLFKHGARDTEFLKSGVSTIKWLRELDQREIMEWVGQIEEEKRMKAVSRPSGLTSPPLQLTSQGTSGRRYYRETHGDLPEMKDNVDSVYESPIVMFKSESKPAVFTWFNHLSSASKDIVPVRGGTNIFLYLDVLNLTNQGLDLETMKTLCKAPKLSARSVKTLNFKQMICKIRMNECEQEAFIMAELKFPHTHPELKQKRIFLWKVLDDRSQATLLVGFKLSNALHEQKDMEALAQSVREEKVIELNVPVISSIERKALD